jgi:hypothetical protein
MGELAVIDNTGDTKVIWDTQNQDEIDAAKMQFDILIGRGFTAYSVKKGGEKNVRITEFDPEAGKIIMVPKIVGG